METLPAAPDPLYDAVVVGGGPAGLSAAIVLGRARRRVVLVDGNQPRNWASLGVRNFLSRDGILPGDLRALGVEEARRYGADVRCAQVETARHEQATPGAPGVFVVGVEDAEPIRARKMLLATGVVDVLPTVPGFRDLYGRGVHHCPYCDAFEYAGGRIASYGRGRKGLGLALALRTWTPDVVVLTNGPVRFNGEDCETIERNGIKVCTERIARLESAPGDNGDGPRLARVLFDTGEGMDLDALFFNTGQVQRSGLAAQLGCQFTKAGGIQTDGRQRTCVPGLFAAGDARREVQFAIVAAAQGATAGVAINRELQDEDRGVPYSEGAARVREAAGKATPEKQEA